jgi:hypothetical protein
LLALWGTLDSTPSTLLTRSLSASSVAARLRKERGPKVGTHKGLPLLTEGRWLKKHPPGIPEWLSWVNYWSVDAAAAAGLDEQTARPKTLGLSQLHREEDGWILRITDAPFDPLRPAHIRQLASVYRRFPRVGRPYRGAPASRPAGTPGDWLVARRVP